MGMASSRVPSLPPSFRTPLPSSPGSGNHKLHEMNQNVWIRDTCFAIGSRVPAPLVPGVPTKTRLESNIKKFNPHFIYDTAVQARALVASNGASKPHTTMKQTQAHRQGFQNGAINRDLRCVLHLSLSVSRAGCKTRLESQIIIFTHI